MKNSFYQPKVENINTIREANMCQQHLDDAIQRVEKLKLLVKVSESTIQEINELQAVNIMSTKFSTEDSAGCKRKRNPSINSLEETYSPTLALNY
ncbi:hypothetical protein Pint_02090 [Pistacia integerrima]|uniref:Uncharacterized protein n=1 Tax=Pistacia integerrima TaxID=434235 RepID=A0ACC0ZMP4_9ROSI|nr:hypothetical protein Pint_02090 [Pistacia integerrima]